MHSSRGILVNKLSTSKETSHLTFPTEDDIGMSKMKNVVSFLKITFCVIGIYSIRFNRREHHYYCDVNTILKNLRTTFVCVDSPISIY